MRQLSLWLPATAILLLSVISYIDRNTLALPSPTIPKETGLSAQQHGLVISAFSIARMTPKHAFPFLSSHRAMGLHGSE